MSKKLVLLIMIAAVTLTACAPKASQGMTLEDLLQKIEFATYPVSFSLESYDSANHTMNVLVNDVPYTLVESKKDSSGIPGTDKVIVASEEQGLFYFNYEIDLFSDEAVKEIQEAGNDFMAFPGGNPYRRTLVLVPTGIMPKVVSNIYFWDDTEAVIYKWPVYFGSRPIFENVTTNEMVIGQDMFYTYDDQHTTRQMVSGGYVWGFIHVEKDNSKYKVYITQSAPDFSLYPAAVELMHSYYPDSYYTESDFTGYGQVCDALTSAVFEGRGDSEEVIAVCGVFFSH